MVTDVTTQGSQKFSIHVWWKRLGLDPTDTSRSGTPSKWFLLLPYSRSPRHLQLDREAWVPFLACRPLLLYMSERRHLNDGPLWTFCFLPKRIKLNLLTPKKIATIKGVFQQLDFNAGSTTHGFSHRALLEVTDDNMALTEHLIAFANASTKTFASFNSWRAVIILFWSTSCSTFCRYPIWN